MDDKNRWPPELQNTARDVLFQARDLGSQAEKLIAAAEQAMNEMNVVRQLLCGDRDWDVIEKDGKEFLTPVGFTYDDFLALKKVIPVNIPKVLIQRAVDAVVAKRKPEPKRRRKLA